MQNRLLRSLRFAAALATAFFGVLVAPTYGQVPEWVPDEYRSNFVRHVDDRSNFERALNHVGLSLRETGRSFALIAGVSRYPNMTGSAATLDPAAEDIAKLIYYLSEYEFFNEIVVLHNEEMTPANLRYFLRTYFPARLREAPNARFLFAYSGHGVERYGAGHLLTEAAHSLGDIDNAISTDELRAWFRPVVQEGHHVLALINACYGGTFLRTSFGANRDTPPQRGGAHAITAGRGDELTWHDPNFGEGKGSIFFEAVIAGLDGRADKLPEDGVVSIRELDTYLHDTISRFSDGEQNPQTGDLLPTQSPGGFFFLDRRRQIERDVVERLDHDRAVMFGRQRLNANKMTPVMIPSDTRLPRPTLVDVWDLFPEQFVDFGRHERRAIQAALNEKGYKAGKEDGVFGLRTREAIRLWQSAQGLPATGYLGAAGLAKLAPSLSMFSRPSLLEPPKFVTWSRSFDRSEKGHKGHFAAIAPSTDGGAFLAGYTAIEGSLAERAPLPSDGSWAEKDGWLVKVDANGEEVWSKTFGGRFDDEFHSIMPSANGGILVAGYTSDKFALTSLRDGWLIKVDANGGEIWSKTFGGSYHDEFRAIAPSADGGVLLAGNTDARGISKSLHSAIPSLVNSVFMDTDGWLVKLDANGDEVWSRNFYKIYDSKSEALNAVAPTANGGAFVAGYTRKDGSASKDGWLIKVDANGDEVWSKTFGGRFDDAFHAILPSADGGAWVAGSTTSGTHDFEDGWLIKVDANGDEVWSKAFGGSDADVFNAMTPSADGGALLVGVTFDESVSSLPIESDILRRNADGWLVKVDANGDEVWSHTFDVTQVEALNSVAPSADGDVMVAGATHGVAHGEASYADGGGVGGAGWLIHVDPQGRPRPPRQ